jgi:23S rRNA pseudouridine1911/1915/1917 synthase
VFEDEHLIVIDKPAGLVVHPAAAISTALGQCAAPPLRRQLSGIGGVARPGIVHRIDKDTSGLMVAAKTDRAHEGLAKQFAGHRSTGAIKAIVTGGRVLPRARSTRRSAGRHEPQEDGDRRRRSGKRASRIGATLEPLKGAALVECRLETGRTHQVRVHMASIGHPLAGRSGLWECPKNGPSAFWKP